MSSPKAKKPSPPKNKQSFLVCGSRFDVDKKYKLIKPIGHGAYGVVCSAVNVETGQKVAIKKITKAFANLVETKRTLREIKLLRHFKHSNIIPIVDILKPDSYTKFEDVYIVNDLMSTDLHQIIRSPQPLSDEHAQYFVYQILRGLKYIHSAHVLHRDLKPSNLLLNANCDLKICDFGLARATDPAKESSGFLTEYVATRWYRAPEIMLSWKEYTKAIDMWSVGCILAEILLRRPLFPGRDYMHQLHLVIDILGTPSKEDTEYIASEKAKAYVRALPYRKGVSFAKIFPKAPIQAVDLISKLLTFSPAKRLTVEQALAHPYFATLHDPADEPSAPTPFDFDLEKYVVSKESLKALLWRELLDIHPDLGEFKAPDPNEFLLANQPQHIAGGHDKGDKAMGVAPSTSGSSSSKHEPSLSTVVETNVPTPQGTPNNQQQQQQQQPQQHRRTDSKGADMMDRLRSSDRNAVSNAPSAAVAIVAGILGGGAAAGASGAAAVPAAAVPAAASAAGVGSSASVQGLGEKLNAMEISLTPAANAKDAAKPWS